MQLNKLKISKITTIYFDFETENECKLTIRANYIDGILRTDTFEVLVVDNWKPYDSLPVETIEILKQELKSQILNGNNLETEYGKNKIKRNFMYVDIVPN